MSIDDMPRPAAIGHEGNDCLSLPVPAVQEGAHRLSHGESPDQGANGDEVGVTDVRTDIPDARHKAFLPFKTLLLHDFITGARVRFHSISLDTRFAPVPCARHEYYELRIPYVFWGNSAVAYRYSA